MAKKKHIESQQDVSKRIQRTENYANKVRQLFAQTVNDILAINKDMPKLDDGVMFSFDAESKRKQTQVEELLRKLHSVATMAIQQGISVEWDIANKECDELVQSCFGKKVLESPEFSAWTQRNTAARDAFINRTDNGMNLSKRIWQSVEQLRDEMEVAMTVAIGEGNSAASISRKVRQYLNDPDLMFRRFRYKIGEDDNGQPVYGRKWKKRIKDSTGKYKWIDYDRNSYKTGAGVYKSSAKNAMRVARTETNIAYRRADHERWQQMDFVLGQKIQLSRKHPHADICDDLAGDYPKDFVFDGWHPQCFCFSTPILISENEMEKVTEKFLQGETYTPRGKQIDDYPTNFKSWVKDHEEDIAYARSRGKEPYFIKNNAMAIDDILHPKQKELTILDRAKLRHDARTPEQEEAIQKKWLLHKDLRHYTDAQKINLNQIEKDLGISRELSMHHKDANEQRPNPNYYVDKKYRINCQSCVLTYELRRRGFDVETLPFHTNLQNKLSHNTNLLWIDPITGMPPKAQRAGGDIEFKSNGYSLKPKSKNVIKKDFDKITEKEGRYHITVCWKGGRSGHIVTCERSADGILSIYDPQTGLSHNLQYYLDRIQTARGILVQRVDNLLFSTGKFDNVFKPLTHVVKVSSDTSVRQSVSIKTTVLGKGNIVGNNGGCLITDPKRIEQANKNKQEMIKFQKEQETCKTVANHGHRVEHLNDSLLDDGRYDVLIDGRKADLKRTKSANHIIDYAKHAIREQGAELVVFQFDVDTPKIREKIEELKRKGFKFMYFFTGRENVLYDFS